MGAILQIYFDVNELAKTILGTYDIALVISGLLFSLLGAILCATGKVWITGENKNSLPTPDPTAFQFIYQSRRGRFIGGFIVVLVILRIFAPQFTNMSLLVLFSFSVGFFNYLLTESLVGLAVKAISKVMPGFKSDVTNEIKQEGK